MIRWSVILLAVLATGLPATAASPVTPTETGQVLALPFAYYQPANWNHETVLYLHDYKTIAGPYTFPDGYDPGLDTRHSEAALVNGLLARGFALGVPEYGPGWSEADAHDQTEMLRSYLAGKYGPSTRTYLIAPGFGALAGIHLLEDTPTHYAGLLAVDAGSAGSLELVDQILTFRAVYNYYAPGLGPVFASGTDLLHLALHFSDQVLPHLLAHAFPGLLTAAQDPTPSAAAQQIAAVTGVHATPGAFGELLGIEIAGAPDLLLRTQGQPFWGNQNVVYKGSSDDAALNKGIERWTAQSAAVDFLKANYEPTGKIGAPLLAIQQLDDPILAPGAATTVAQRFAAAGTSALFAARPILSHGHDPVYSSEIQGFDDLVA